ncbi:arsenic resistance protein [Tsukamurella tyrosinosolvens]|uniref:Arsenite efflux pump ArsB, ACR3 family n=1 Tax=Tsukamurella tyrosinosolvens TaxID=57704 RepID=A0A1H5BDG1_TSUTY|nr:bile acid:sodium symporter [Tsukamurella tyrosinosolvens]KXO95136.1 arsenic resistance protein [Tsukamurella tyrosinosolvens]SED52612.1 Arsenite efflux pump ArsB, ACR3 family [Tsukamurella tyrosinosolvens]
MRSAAGWAEAHQVPLYLAGLVLGAVLGLAVPTVAGPAEAVINPVLSLLLYATFLGIPFARMGEALRDVRFLGTVLAVNFVAVPVVVFALSRIVAHDRVLLVGVLFVLLTPCVDYVIVFSGLAGGAKDRLLAAAPLLMLVQMVLLPVYLWLFVGADVVRTVEYGPFAEAFVWVIVVPLLLAGATQCEADRTRWGAALAAGVAGAMVPIMVLTLAVVVASQIAGVRDQLASLLLTVPVYVLFAVVMTPVGAAAGRLAGLDVPSRRSVVFSGVTRNSLVILPLVLALPAAYALAPLVVVTQTLVELVVMVLFVRLIPRFIR